MTGPWIPKAEHIGRQPLLDVQSGEAHEEKTSGNDMNRLQRENGKDHRIGAELETSMAEIDLDILEGRFQRWLACRRKVRPIQD